MYRAVVGMMEHETNTFSPVPTPFARFGAPEVPTGDDVVRLFKGTGTGLGGFLDVAVEEGMDLVTPIAANAAPSGPVQAGAYAAVTNAICGAIEAGCDLCFLDLHGAMVTETTDDGEGTLLQRIRSIAPDLPIAVSLDLHANITDRIVDNCSVLVGYKSYPHVDMDAAGRHAGKLLARMLKGEVNPVMAWGRRPILAQTLRMGHDDEPMGPMLEMAKAEERAGLLAASVFGGFPLADIRDAGLSVVTVADGDKTAATAAADRLLQQAWQRKQQWVFQGEPLADSITKAKAIEEGPVILLDHADNTGSGGTQDTMAVIAEVIRQELQDVAVFGICDSQAVEQMIAAGVGQEATLDLGGKTDMEQIGLHGVPLRLTGRVRTISDGKFVVTAAMGRGKVITMGKSAVFETGHLQIVVCSRHIEPFDLGCFKSLGIDPAAKRYLVLKSRIHYRAGFRAIAKAEIPCNGVGVTSSDNTLFKFRKVRRPIYPLDPDCPEFPNYQPEDA